MQTSLTALIKDTPAGREARRHPAQLRPLRFLRGELPDLPAPGRRAGRPARTHLPHQVPPGGARGGPHHPGPSRSLPGLPRVRDRLFLEPGRAIAANAGVLLSRVQYTKLGGQRKFVIVDTGMHHLIRPAMYGSTHFIWPTWVRPQHMPPRCAEDPGLAGLESCDIVGPICETADVLATGRLLPPVARGNVLCIYAAGAYGMVMASNYNATPRPAEVLVSGEQATIIRRRETIEDLVSHELKSLPVRR
jgi:pyridoxal-dependent decarboxylase-like protein